MVVLIVTSREVTLSYEKRVSILAIKQWSHLEPNSGEQVQCNLLFCSAWSPRGIFRIVACDNSCKRCLEKKGKKTIF